ncbi:MAG: hypothetical protein PHE12_03015 [Clostridia bacterium]|nr:hypothetical protein [Clostridia bacterium]
MYKKLSVIAVLLLVLALCGCSNELKLDEDYNYSGVSFNVSKNLKDEDLGAFYPAFNNEVRTIKGLEKYIEDNIDVYCINKIIDNITQKVYFSNTIEKIKLTNDKCFVTVNGDTQSYTYTENNNTFTVMSNEEVLYTFYFETGKFCYRIELIKGFEVVHNFKL